MTITPMNELTSIPTRAYQYVDTQFGTIGLIVSGLLIVVAVIYVFIWIDRRK